MDPDDERDDLDDQYADRHAPVERTGPEGLHAQFERLQPTRQPSHDRPGPRGHRHEESSVA